MLYKIQSGDNWKTRKLHVCAMHFESLPETDILSLEEFKSTVTKLLSGRGNMDADANDAATADLSTPYMSPSEATQKSDNSTAPSEISSLFWS